MRFLKKRFWNGTLTSLSRRPFLPGGRRATPTERSNTHDRNRKH